VIAGLLHQAVAGDPWMVAGDKERYRWQEEHPWEAGEYQQQIR